MSNSRRSRPENLEISLVEKHFDENLTKISSSISDTAKMQLADQDQSEYAQAICKKVERLASTLQSNFPICNQPGQFELFPFSNEYGHWRVIKKLKTVKIETDQEGVALFFGEAHFISYLPYLPATKLVILADIDPRLHRQTQHMLACLREANTPEEYKEKFSQNHFDYYEDVPKNYVNRPAKDRETYIKLHIDRYERVSNGELSFHFLHHQKNYDRCKAAVSQLSFVHIELNLMDALSCDKMAHILKEYNALFTFCNFTNIHDYDIHHVLQHSVPLLLKNAPHCLVMYSIGEKVNSLRTTISIGLEDYFMNPYCGAFPYVALCSNTMRLIDGPWHSRDHILCLQKQENGSITVYVKEHDGLKSKILTHEEMTTLLAIKDLPEFPMNSRNKHVYLSKYDHPQDLINQIVSACGFSRSIQFPPSSNQLGFFSLKKNTHHKAEKLLNEICYVPMYDEHWRDIDTLDTKVEDLIEGKEVINELSDHLRAYSSYDIAMSKLIGSSDWLFTVRGNKDEINQLLSFKNKYYMGDQQDEKSYYPFDPIDAGFKFSSCIISATNKDKTKCIIKTRHQDEMVSEVSQFNKYHPL